MSMGKRRCLKFTGYMYIPDKEVLNDPKEVKYWIGKNPGRIQMHDEKGNKDGKMQAFISIGDMSNRILKQWDKMWKTRFAK